jgi:peptidoglycan glycosyltransferase
MRAGPEIAGHRYLCERLPDGRVGQRLNGWRRPIRDDAKDRMPHGVVSLERGLVVSCNAYFAQLAVDVGQQALRETARDFDIALTASDAPSSRLRATLPFVGFGQGEVVATPARLAQVVSTIASGGVLAPYVWVRDPTPRSAAPRRMMSRAAAADLGFAMREAVTSGTARGLKGNRTAIAGKTGTAELEGQPSHAWFAGFAPYGSAGRKIAFVVLVENGGYGARAAAPIAGAIVDLARELRIIQ